MQAQRKVLSRMIRAILWPVVLEFPHEWDVAQMCRHFGFRVTLEYIPIVERLAYRNPGIKSGPELALALAWIFSRPAEYFAGKMPLHLKLDGYPAPI